MENARVEPKNQVLSPCRSRRRSNDCNSPEFEFWMVRNPSFPQPHLLSADELFVDGVLLPLHLLPRPSETTDSVTNTSSENPRLETEADAEPEPGPGPESSVVLPETSSTTVFSMSKRWKDIFKMGEKKPTTATRTTNGLEDREKDKEKDKEKEKKKDRKGSSGASAAELNINIWPFSRSRSAGNSGNRPKMSAGAAGTRKVSSAPCSRSNSAGESKSRKWPSSPGRGGIHLGRSSPVWQVRRAGPGLKNSDPIVRSGEKGVKKQGSESRRAKTSGGDGGGGRATTKVKALNLNVPMCIGYRQRLSCRTDENDAVVSGGGGVRGGGNSAASSGVGAGNEGSGVNNLFNLRTLFSKKVY